MDGVQVYVDFRYTKSLSDSYKLLNVFTTKRSAIIYHPANSNNRTKMISLTFDTLPSDQV